MRILSFSEKFPKLQQPVFTTFRYPYWRVGETVQVFYKSRSPEREKLGIAEIVSIEHRELDPRFDYEGRPLVTEAEAIADGFASRADMVLYMQKQYGRNFLSCLDKLTLRWVVG